MMNGYCNMRTWAEWNSAGYHILKGQKAEWVDGVAKFAPKQVERTKPKKVYRRKVLQTLNGDKYVQDVDVRNKLESDRIDVELRRVIGSDYDESGFSLY